MDINSPILKLILILIAIYFIYLISKTYEKKEVEFFQSALNSQFPVNKYFTISYGDLYLTSIYDKASGFVRAVVRPRNYVEQIQEWEFFNGRLINRGTQSVLAVYQDAKADGIPVALTTPKETNGQFWMIDNNGIIRTRLSGGKLSASPTTANVVIKISRGLTGNWYQTWKITPTEVIDVGKDLQPPPEDPVKREERIKTKQKTNTKNMLKKFKKFINKI
jgi:hypothetical protein